MINRIKRLIGLCKHEWKLVDKEYYLGRVLSKHFRCTVCGKTEEVLGSKEMIWAFEQKAKGETFV